MPKLCYFPNRKGPGPIPKDIVSDWEDKGPCAIVPFTWKMAHQSLCRPLQNGRLKVNSWKKAENGRPLVKNLFPITAKYLVSKLEKYFFCQ